MVESARFCLLPRRGHDAVGSAARADGLPAGPRGAVPEHVGLSGVAGVLIGGFRLFPLLDSEPLVEYCVGENERVWRQTPLFCQVLEGKPKGGKPVLTLRQPRLVVNSSWFQVARLVSVPRNPQNRMINSHGGSRATLALA